MQTSDWLQTQPVPPTVTKCQECVHLHTDPLCTQQSHIGRREPMFYARAVGYLLPDVSIVGIVTLFQAPFTETYSAVWPTACGKITNVLKGSGKCHPQLVTMRNTRSCKRVEPHASCHMTTQWKCLHSLVSLHNLTMMTIRYTYKVAQSQEKIKRRKQYLDHSMGVSAVLSATVSPLHPPRVSASVTKWKLVIAGLEVWSSARWCLVL